MSKFLMFFAQISLFSKRIWQSLDEEADKVDLKSEQIAEKSASIFTGVRWGLCTLGVK